MSLAKGKKFMGENSAKKLEEGRFILIDSERPRYKPLHMAFANWPKVETTTGPANTTIWIKP